MSSNEIQYHSLTPTGGGTSAEPSAITLSPSWALLETHEWSEPLEVAAAKSGDIALLYSGMREGTSGRTSFLFTQPLETIEGDNFSQLPASAAADLPEWVGYLGYGMRVPKTPGAPSPIVFPNFRFTRYAQMLRFDHVTRKVEAFAKHTSPFKGEVGASASGGGTLQDSHKDTPTRPLGDLLPIGGSKITLASNFSRAQYEAAVARTVAAIEAGDFYQANLTRKFWGEFPDAPDALALYTSLAQISPAPYSAFIRHGSQAILSSSPECFLTVEATGQVTTRPIKGSARRSADVTEDARIRTALTASEKNLAENLMIVDLMRNDLSRVCEAGSVRVAEQSGLYSYATIHHLISTISGQKRADATLPDLLSACFPPGSMTGAPKIAAMRWCEAEERRERGVYSGAVGWYNANACDFSVVIRTLLLDGNHFEFQVGGGIVADSSPEDEWRETLIKARGICAALGIREETLAAI